MKKSLLISFLLINFNCISQKTDSIKIWKLELEKIQSDSPKIFLYSKVIKEYYGKDNISAFRYLLEAECNTHSLLTTLWSPTIYHYSSLLHSNDIQLTDSILKIKLKEPNNSKRNRALYYYLLSINASLKSDMNTAFENAFNSLRLFEDMKDNDGIIQLHFSLANYYLKTNKLEVGKKMIYELNSNLSIKTKKIVEYEKRFYLATYYQILGKKDSALHAFLSAVKFAPNYEQKAVLISQVGELHILLKNYDEAISYFQLAINTMDSLGNQRNVAIWKASIGHALSEKGNYADAIKSFKSALEIQTQLNNLGDLARTYNYLSKAYELQRNFESAYHYHLLFDSINDSLKSEQAMRNIADMQMKYQTEKKDKEILLQNEQLSLQRIINWSIAGVAILLVLLVLFVYKGFLQKKKSNVELEIAKQKADVLRERAEQSEKFKQQFLANMSHEIRTPMNAVMGMTNLLLDKNPRNDQFNYLDGIKKSSDTLLYIINDILDLSKIEAGKIELEQIDFSIIEVIEQVKQTLNYKAEEKGLHLTTDIDKNIPPVIVGDPVRLNQVLINLAGNAIKFTEKGSVTITCKLLDNTKEEKEKNLEISNLKFELIDTGIGIPKDKLQTVFENFTQAHASDTRNFGGTGLGLSISKQLVELMGGRILVESEVNAGTVFSFKISYPTGSYERIKERQLFDQIDGSILNGLKVLVVDDNEYNRIVAHDTLKSKATIDITESTNGKEAIEILEQKDFDVILMDVQMPLLNGYETTRYIRENFTKPKNQIPIIALTASVVRSDLDKCRDAGMDDYVPKPFKTSQLISAIAKATGREIKFIKKEIEVKKAPSNSSDITDLAYLENFCEGSKERMKKYITMFLESAPILIEKINTSLVKQDYEEIANQIHSYKTKWIMMGMNTSKELALNIEKQCREEYDEKELTKNISTLIEQIQKAINELNNSVKY